MKIQIVMKKIPALLMSSCVILALLVFSSSPTPAFETNGLIPQIEILTPGTSRTIEITQNYDFPQDSAQVFLLVIGYGGVSITLRKNDTEGDTLILAGLGISSAGIAPIFKFGITKVTLAEAVEIGSERLPYGLLWVKCWVDSSVNDPPYYYTLAFSF